MNDLINRAEKALEASRAYADEAADVSGYGVVDGARDQLADLVNELAAIVAELAKVAV